MISSLTLAKWYLSLLPAEPPQYWQSSEPLQRARMEYDDECSAEGFHTLFRFNLQGRDVLDLGCGYGGRTVRYKEMGARSVVGVEISSKMVAEAEAFARTKGVEISTLVGTGENLPLADNCVDAVLSYDVFEHVESIARTVAECYRVLRPGGTLYAVFPPFYHPTGGSHLHGYLSRSPAPNLLFPCPMLCRAIDEMCAARGGSFRPTRRPSDPLPTVNGTTIRKFSRILGSVPFFRKEVRFDPLRSRRFFWLNPVARLGSRLPLLREVCTSRIHCELTK